MHKHYRVVFILFSTFFKLWSFSVTSSVLFCIYCEPLFELVSIFFPILSFLFSFVVSRCSVQFLYGMWNEVSCVVRMLIVGCFWSDVDCLCFLMILSWSSWYHMSIFGWLISCFPMIPYLLFYVNWKYLCCLKSVRSISLLVGLIGRYDSYQSFQILCYSGAY